MAYSSQTVAQLKEQLKAKGLSTAGVKSDLIARLEASDKPESTEAATEAATETKAETPAEPAPEAKIEKSEETAETPAGVSSSTATAAAGDAEKTLTVIEPEKKEKPKEMTADERKAAAIELLEKKIARAKRFGPEESIAACEKDLARVKKFGVELGTALAAEIGLSSGQKPLGSGNGKFGNGKVFKKRHGKKFHKR